LSDLALRGRIIEALTDAPDVDVAEIAVECDDDGDVVLRGSVVDLLQRAEAVRTARGVPGVGAVDDQLRTRPVGTDHRADAEIEAAVLDALILEHALPAYGIDVDVDGGQVTLCGAVDIASEREAAERIARRVPGVSDVRNRLKVWVTAYANRAGSGLLGSTRPSWWREVRSSLVKTLRRW
jgi:osmotically-inducible protein OsmY